MSFNYQTFFDQVLDHLRYQGVRSGKQDYTYSSGFQCLYRDAKGNACAVGVAIPKAVYTPAMEGMQARSLIAKYPKLLAIWNAAPNEVSKVVDFLSRLQSAHDTYMPTDVRDTASMREWETNMLRIAKDFKLNYRPGEVTPHPVEYEAVMPAVLTPAYMAMDTAYMTFEKRPKYDYSNLKSKFDYNTYSWETLSDKPYEEFTWQHKEPKAEKLGVPKTVQATSATPASSAGSKTKSLQSLVTHE